jgi:ribosomal protein S18 acetylase RimI-like enzyme
MEVRDLAAIDEILKQWLIDSQTGELDVEELDQDMVNLRGSLEGENAKQYFVATEGDRVVGVMGYSELKPELLPFVKTTKPGELINAYVHKDLQGGAGVGTALLNTIESLAKSKGCTEVILDSGPRHRLTGHPFYIKKGYEKAGIIPDYYGPGGDTTVFRREI